jgi:type IV secretion system protein VirB9
MRAALLLVALLVSVSAHAQSVPVPGADNPRVQTARWQPGTRIVLTSLPGTPLTVTLEPGDPITRVTLSDDRVWAVKVSSERDGFTILPERGAAAAELTVETTHRVHEFDLTIGSGLAAAYLVRIAYSGSDAAPETADSQLEPGEQRWAYRLSGNRAVRPAEIFDDGARTWIGFALDQPLPAIFAIGASGEEEVVNGYMRRGRFVIDRVHEQLVFRIDRAKAVARRRGEETAKP